MRKPAAAILAMLLITALMLYGCTPQTQAPVLPEESPIIYADESATIRSLGNQRISADSGDICAVQIELHNLSNESITLSSVLCIKVSSPDGGVCERLYGQSAVDALQASEIQYLSPDGMIPAGSTKAFTLCFVPNSSSGEYVASIALNYAAEKWIDFYVDMPSHT